MSEQSTPPPLDEYLTVNEAAKFLGISPWTLRNWDRAGRLTCRRHPKNGYRIYRHEELEAVLSATEPRQQRNGPVDWNSVSDTEHFVQFYESDRSLVDSVGGFLAPALSAGAGGIII